jgi:hypothetical protein
LVIAMVVAVVASGVGDAAATVTTSVRARQ